MSDADDLPGTTVDVGAYPDPDDLVTQVLVRLHLHGSVVIHDPVERRFDSFIVMWWRGVYVVRGEIDSRLGTFASIEKAIRAGRAGPIVCKEVS